MSYHQNLMVGRTKNRLKNSANISLTERLLEFLQDYDDVQYSYQYSYLYCFQQLNYMVQKMLKYTTCTGELLPRILETRILARIPVHLLVTLFRPFYSQK